MAINALQVAWLARLVRKGIIRPGSSIIEFGPQDLLCSRKAVEIHAHLNPAWSKIDEIFDGDFEADLQPDYDFDALPIGMEQLKDPNALKEITAASFVRNYELPETLKYGEEFPGRCFDYCLVALRKRRSSAFRYPNQRTYHDLLSRPTERRRWVWLKMRLRDILVRVGLWKRQ